MSFRFLNQEEPSSYATSLANGMHTYSVPHTVSGPYLHFQCDLEEISEYLAHFTPTNSIISVSHKGFAGTTTLKEKWYGTEHNKRDFTAEEVQKWQACLQPGSEWADALFLPLPNPFIPTDFELKAATESVTAEPQLVERVGTSAVVLDLLQEIERPAEVAAAVVPPVPPTATEEASAGAEDGETEEDGEEDGEDDEGEGEEEEGTSGSDSGAELPVLQGEKLLTWHLQDKNWAVPKVNVKVSLENMLASSTALGVALTEMFAMCLKENLNEYSYYADCAGKSILIYLIYLVELQF